MHGKDPLQEILPEHRVGQAPLLLHRQQGEPCRNRCGKEPLSASDRHPLVIDLDPEQTRTRRSLLEDEAAQLFVRQLLHFPPAERFHLLRQIEPAAERHQTGRCGFPFQVHRLARDRQPALHFRADRDEPEEPSQGVGEVAVVLVAAVVADLFPQEAAADAHGNGFAHSRTKVSMSDSSTIFMIRAYSASIIR